MKTLHHIFAPFALLAFVLGLAACGNEGVSYLRGDSQAAEKMTLTASVSELTLDPEKLLDEVLTFTWTAAREMPDEYLVSYISKLDIQGNNFANAIRTQENEFAFSKSYTTEELQNILLDKWGRPASRPTTIEFEILAKWDGGPVYVMPEVRTASVSILPYRPITFDFDKLFVGGSAVPGSRGQLVATPENEFIYVWTGQLVAGELEMPAEYQGITNYICPMESTVVNGAAESASMQASAIRNWSITEAGEYRVIVDIAKQTVTIFTPGNVLQPAIVEWTLDGAPQITTVTGLWMYGESTGWAWGPISNPDFKPSLIDPQIFYYSGSARNGRTKFGVHPHNQAYVYGPVNTTGADIASVPIQSGVETDLGEGFASYQRNTYFGLPSGTNYMVIDIRNKKITVGQR